MNTLTVIERENQRVMTTAVLAESITQHQM